MFSFSEKTERDNHNKKILLVKRSIFFIVYKTYFSLFNMRDTFMKYLLMAFAFFLPLHALIVTVQKCRFEANTDIIRFWKEFVVIGLLF